MTDTCTCPPDDCHGGHTINVGPAARFHEIPQTVSAIRWTGDNADAIKTWVGHTPQGELRFLLPDEVSGQWESPGLFNDSALEWESVYPGDWIVQRPDGVFTRCDHEVFTATHRPETDTITAGPAWVCVADERLRQLRDDPDVCTNPGERSMADELLAARARITELEASQPYREVWSDEVPPGGMVCSTCGGPVESEPCPEHAPAEPIGHTIGYNLGNGPVFDWQFLGSLEQAKDRIANNALRRPWRIFELREVDSE